MRDAIIPEQHASRSLLFNAKPAERCWAAKQAGAKLVVRAECTGTMDHLGLMTAPSMTAGTVTVSGLPYAAFTASPAYQKAFVLAMEAAQCQCDVTDPTCINDECAGNVEIEKTGG